MDRITFTAIAAVILMGFAVLGLAIGWLITGKSRLRRGSCGMIPGKNKEKKTGCDLCGSQKTCDEDKEKE